MVGAANSNCREAGQPLDIGAGNHNHKTDVKK